MADGNITVEVSTQAAQDELARLRAQNDTLKRDLQYARDGLTKGRSRMREDNARLANALRELVLARLRAQNDTLKRDLQYARDGLTKGRSRMREDNARLANALRELVALEDMRLRLRQLHEMGHGTDYYDYHRRLPLAWDAARAALGPNASLHIDHRDKAPWPDMPKEPPLGLLMSMAISFDHGLGVPGYYDSEWFRRPGQPSHKQRVEATLTMMRQLYEEVSGHGFYSTAKEAEYAALADSRPPNAAGNRLARQGQSELTGLLGPGSEA